MTSQNDIFDICLMTSKDAEEVAKLHIEGIHKGFISTLGVTFVKALYEAIAESEYGFGYVAKLDDRVKGFIAFTEN